MQKKAMKGFNPRTRGAINTPGKEVPKFVARKSLMEAAK